MYYSIDPENRAEFVSALRNLADFLAANPGVPVPLNGDVITLHASGYEDGGRAQVDHIARLLGATVTDDTANGGHYVVTREFGPLAYMAVAIPDSRMARFDAETSYRGCVTPDTDRHTIAREIRCESCVDTAQQCESCRDAQEFEDRRVSVRRTQEAWWL